jgi:hypothetical protein
MRPPDCPDKSRRARSAGRAEAGAALTSITLPSIQWPVMCVDELFLVKLRLTARDLERTCCGPDSSPLTRYSTSFGKIVDLSSSKYSRSRRRRREGKKRNSIKSSKLIGLLAKVA